ncbi:type I toxin-antitoxin system SymE family toxin [Dickeya dadantii]|uniref:SymE family type I addiction module toxin n=1 Tax=Dickeya dadantii TaxID=204038 RepID=UPI001CF35B58|nr:SymE family type I addiction module toxin [Dickeya dadantii]MCA7015361.1 type I toxin-antitoxin system SymE family toxin [Dickeya dadantii]
MSLRRPPTSYPYSSRLPSGYRNGLMLTRLDDDTDIAALVAELDGSDNGELTLSGDWLTQSGLLNPPFSIEALPG